MNKVEDSGTLPLLLSLLLPGHYEVLPAMMYCPTPDPSAVRPTDLDLKL